MGPGLQWAFRGDPTTIFSKLRPLNIDKEKAGGRKEKKRIKEENDEESESDREK